MTDPLPDLFCPACNVTVPDSVAVYDGGGGPAFCPTCHGLLRPHSSGFGNPLSLSVLGTIAGPFARLLKRVGVLEYLEARAKSTKNKLDDAAIRVARHIIEEIAAL